MSKLEQSLTEKGCNRHNLNYIFDNYIDYNGYCVYKHDVTFPNKDVHDKYFTRNMPKRKDMEDLYENFILNEYRNDLKYMLFYKLKQINNFYKNSKFILYDSNYREYIVEDSIYNLIKNHVNLDKEKVYFSIFGIYIESCSGNKIIYKFSQKKAISILKNKTVIDFDNFKKLLEYNRFFNAWFDFANKKMTICDYNELRKYKLNDIVKNLKLLKKLTTVHNHTGKKVYYYGKSFKAWYIDTARYYEFEGMRFGPNYISGCFNPYFTRYE